MAQNSHLYTLRSISRRALCATVLLISLTMAGANIIAAFANETSSVSATVSQNVYSQIEQGNKSVILTLASLETKQTILERLSTELSLIGENQFSELPILAVDDVTVDDVNAISNFDGVVSIESVQELSGTSISYIDAIKGTNIYKDDSNTTVLSGKGTVVGIIDSGINTNDVFLQDGNGKSRIVAQGCVAQQVLDFSPCDTRPGKEAHLECHSELTSCWHGQSVAALAVGSHLSLVSDELSAPYEMGGVAPNAGISFFRIADSDSSGPTSLSILVAFNKFLSDKKTNPVVAPDVINISIGFQYLADPSCSAFPALELAVNSLVAAGITVVASSGNEGNKNFVASPGCYDSSIAVGATEYNVDPNGGIINERVTSFTNTSSKLDVVAPGSGLIGVTPDPSYFMNSIKGTSFAVPLVSGTVALLKEANPKLTPLEIKSILKTTGDLVTDPATGKSYPRINAEKAVAAAKNTYVPDTTETTASTSQPTISTPQTNSTIPEPSTTIPGTSPEVTTVPTSNPVYETQPTYYDDYAYDNNDEYGYAYDNNDEYGDPTYVDVAGESVTNYSEDTLPFTGSNTSGQILFAAAWLILAGIMVLCFKEGFSQIALARIASRIKG